MKRVLNIILLILALVLIVIVAGIKISSQPLPSGEEGSAAEALTDSMLNAVNLPAWESLRYVSWTNRGARSYVWDRWYNLAEITWDDKRVLLSLNTLEGKAWYAGTELVSEEKRKLLQKAWELWCNDSFWLNPIVKLRDEGTERRFVELKSGEQGLLVTYTEGGVTPGDSFMWVLGTDGLPLYCRMWVSILPVKGIKVTWDEWVSLEGALVAQAHQIGPVKITISELKSGNHHSDLGLTVDPFGDFN